MARKKKTVKKQEAEKETKKVQGPLYLGLDIGTGKIAAVLVDREYNLVAVESEMHGAELHSAIQRRYEQDPKKLLEFSWELIGKLPKAERKKVRAVGVSTQMHGILAVDERLQPLTPLVTWQDCRCQEETGFLETLQEKAGHCLSSGYGTATAAWWRQNGQMPEDVSAFSTIGSLAAARLAGLERPVLDATDAAAWGAFDVRKGQWDTEALKAMGLEPALFPSVADSGVPLGALDADMASKLGLPSGIPVAAALGDNQAALIATLDEPGQEVALTIGTGAQLSAIILSEECPVPPGDAAWECRPFPGGRSVIVAASLSGGNAWTWLAETVRSWLDGLNAEVPSREALFARLNHLGLVSSQAIEFLPHFVGERHAPQLRGSITGLDMSPMDLGSLARGLAFGIVRNMAEMMPESVMKGRKRVIGSGNAMRKNPLLVKAAEEVLGLQVTITGGREESAVGAAKYAALAAEQAAE